MKSGLILIIPVAAVLFTSCSTMYKTGQTPDDVYYSPARPSEEYVQVNNNDNRDGHNYGGSSTYNNNNYTASDDWWLRMRVTNPNRWSAFDDYDWNDYRYNSWAYNYSSPYSWNLYWNNYYTWNSFYNPYCSHIIIINPKANPGVYNNVRNFSLKSYTNTNYNIQNTKTPFRGLSYPANQTNGRYNNNNSNSGGLGNSIRRVFSNGTSNGSYNGTNSSGGDRSSRSYTPSTSGGSSGGGGGSRSGGGGGGGGGSTGSRPGRG